MDATATAFKLVLGEARALMTRLERVMPFSLHMTMVAAAGASTDAQRAIQAHIDRHVHQLRQSLTAFVREMEERPPAADQAQRRLSLLKLHFNLVLSHFDIYSDVLVQRSEHEHGVQLAGLDEVACDGMRIPGYTAEMPPVLCYLDRGQGAAIRRARTRLPGGGDNPVALIRVPRERMVGSGIGSSLIHEVGHQVAALLDLVAPLRVKLTAQAGGDKQSPWMFFERWISEIVADYWSVLKLGVSSTLGLIGVVSLPTAFVFRIGLDDPHPFPWIRVQLSCAIGQALYPDRQWPTVAAAWGELYPLRNQAEGQQQLIRRLLAGLPAFIELLMAFRPRPLGGRSLGELTDADATPSALRLLSGKLRGASEIPASAPTTTMAAIGQARYDGRMTAANESMLLRKLLVHWALRRYDFGPGGSRAQETTST